MTHAFIFIGPSGSGKGTQVKNLKELLASEGGSICSVEAGAAFREFIQGDRFLEKRSKKIYEIGKRQPDFLAVHMWSRVLVEQYEGEENIIFDGTPRSLNEARVLDTALRFLQTDKVYVISLALDDKTATERLLNRGRLDDDPYGIAKRLAWFKEDVVPAIEFYKNHPQHTFVEVDGKEKEEQVWEKIHKALAA